MRIIVCALALCISSWAGADAQTLPFHAESVVKVMCVDNSGTSYLTGSVIACDSGTIVVVTNSHGLRDGVREIHISAGVHTAAADVAYAGNPDNKRTDLLVLVCRMPMNLPVIPLASQSAAIGEPVFHAGFPGGGALAAKSGVVLRRSTDGNPISSFATQSGHSGGPVTNARGELVAVLWGTDGAQSYAVDLGHLVRVLETQCRGGVCQIRPVQRLIQRAGQIIRGPPASMAPRRNIRQPVFQSQDSQPIAQPSLPAPPVSPIFSAPANSPPTIPSVQPIDYASIVSAVVDNPLLLDKLAADGRFRGKDGVDGSNGSSGQPGSGGPPAVVDYDAINDRVTKDPTLRDRVVASTREILGTSSTIESVTKIAAAFGLQLAIPGGVVGFAAFKMLGLWWRHRQRRHEVDAQVQMSKPAGGPDAPFDQPTTPSVSAETPAAPNVDSAYAPETVTRTRHEMTRVPTINREAEALNEALMREAKAFPKHAAVVQRVRSVAKQLLHGTGMRDAGRGSSDEQKFGVGWTD